MPFVKTLDQRRARDIVKPLDHLARLGTLAEANAEVRSEAPMTLVVGDQAPSFLLEGLDGQQVSLAQHRGRPVLVAFLRNAQCAVCNFWVHTAAQRAPAWREEGLEVIAVFEATAAALRAQFGERRPPFAVLADPDGAAHDAFGSRNDADRVQAVVQSGSAKDAIARAEEAGFPLVHEEGSNFFRLPAEVLVRADGSVARVHVAENVADHLPEEVIVGFARSAR